MVRKLGIVVITAIFATAFWILYFGLQQPAGTRADGTIEASGDKARALADFQRAVALDPAHFEACQNLDYLLAHEKRWDRPGAGQRN